MNDEREERFMTLLEEDQNDPAIQFEIGLCYLRGDGVAQNGQEADKWLHRAAEQGHEEAQAMLEAPRQRNEANSPTEETLPEWCMRAEDGDAEAQYRVAVYFMKHCMDCGTDVERYLQGAVEQGHPAACVLLASLRLKQPDRSAEAEELLCNAADCGIAKAAEMLGVCYATGYGVRRDPEEAERRFIQAAQIGGGEKMLTLAVRYATGNMVPTSTGRALSWLKRAENAGCSNAETRYHAACKKVEDQRAETRRKAEEGRRQVEEDRRKEEALRQQKEIILAQQKEERRKVAEKIHIAAVRDREKATVKEAEDQDTYPLYSIVSPEQETAQQKGICNGRRQQTAEQREAIRRQMEKVQYVVAERRQQEILRQQEIAKQSLPVRTVSRAPVQEPIIQQSTQEADSQKEQRKQEWKNRLLKYKDVIYRHLVNEAKGAWHILGGISSTFWTLVVLGILLVIGFILLNIIIELYLDDHPIWATGLILIGIRTVVYLKKGT